MRSLNCLAVILAFVVVATGIIVLNEMASAEDLSVETYCALSIARLEQAVRILEEEGRTLTDDDERVLWAAHGTTRETFYGYAAGHRETVRTYLATHPDMKERLDLLSARFRGLVESNDPARGSSEVR